MLENDLNNLMDISASGDGAALLDEDAFVADETRPEQSTKRKHHQRKESTAVRPSKAIPDALDMRTDGSGEVVTSPTSDNAGYVNLTSGVGEASAAGVAGAVVEAVATADGEAIADVGSVATGLAGEARQAASAAYPPFAPPTAAEATEMAARLHPGTSIRPPLSRIPSKSYAHVKRAMDVACAALALIVLSPVLLVCAIAVKATSTGPVLFRQERWGRKRTRFECWKFRTMVVETPPDMPAQDFEDKASFMTPVGDFLRRWSLDELPQLLNILKGDMSVVGPRPVIIREERLIELRDPVNADAVRPGLTGWAQVNGRNLVTDEEKAFLDGEYVANMSLGFDARVFFRTITAVLSRRGVDRRADQKGTRA